MKMGKKIEKIFVKTYGCQMNVFDSERIEDSLSNFGIRKVKEPQWSDLILLNTCHIREKAAEKVYSELGRFKKIKRENPGIKIGVIGCVAQAEGQEIMQRSKIVDMVLGPQVYHRLPDIIRKIQNGLGLAIVSTSKGIMTDNDARNQNVGGEIICRVF